MKHLDEQTEEINISLLPKRERLIIRTLMVPVLADSRFTDSNLQIKFSHIPSALLSPEYVISFVKSRFFLMMNSNTELIHFGNNLSSSAQWNDIRK